MGHKAYFLFEIDAAGLGLEPRYRDSKSRVLPLDDPANLFKVFYHALNPSGNPSI